MSSQRARVASGTVARAATMVIGFLTIIPFSRILGPTEIGLYFWVLSIIMTADGLVNGFIVAIRKRIPEVQSDLPELLGVLVVVVFPFTILVALTVASVLNFFHITDLSTAAIVFFIFVPFVISTAAKRVIVGLERVDIAQWLQTGRIFVRVSLQFLLLFLGFGVTGMFAGYTVAMALFGIVGFLIVGIRPELPSQETLRSVWEFARYSIPSGVVSRLDESADQMIVGFLFVSSAVGNYGVAARLVEPALLLTGVIQGSLAARLSRLESKGVEVGKVIRDNLAFTGVLAIPIFFGALAIPKHIIITLFSSQYSEAATLLVVLAGTRVLKSYSSPMTSAVSGLDRPRAFFWINAISSASMIISAVIFALVIGPIGVAFGLLLSMILRISMCGYVLLDYTDISNLIPSEVPRQFLSGLIMFLFVELLDQVFISGTISIIVTIILGAIIYWSSLFLLSKEARQHAISLINRIPYMYIR